MARTDTLGNFLTDVAEAIRTKKGTTDTIQASEFDTEIASIESGGDIDEYFNTNISSNSTSSSSNYSDPVLKVPPYTLGDNVTSLYYCFYGYKYPTIDVSSFNTENIKRMDYMFFSSALKNINLSNFNTKNVTNYNSMFFNCNRLATIDISSFDLKSYVNKSSMFSSTGTGCTVADGAYAAGIPYVYVKNEEVQNIVLTATNCPSTWSKNNVVIIDLSAIKIKGSNKLIMSEADKTQYKIEYIGGKENQKDINWVCEGNGTITDGIITLNEEAQVGDIITITAISAYDNSISDSMEITLVPGMSSDYQQVEYIQSNGSQCINTNYKHKASTKIEISCNVSHTHHNDWEALFGARNNNYMSNAFVFFSRRAGSETPVYNRSGEEQTGSNFIYEKDIVLECEYEKATWTDGENTYNITIPINSSIKYDNGVNNMYIFDLNTASSGGNQQDKSKVEMKLYYFNVYEDDVPVRKFVPCYRKSDNVIGLYELYNGTFHANTGTGSFTKGEDV